MTFSPRALTEPFDEATQAGARAMYDEAHILSGTSLRWEQLVHEQRMTMCRAFAAGQAAAEAVAITIREG